MSPLARRLVIIAGVLSAPGAVWAAGDAGMERAWTPLHAAAVSGNADEAAALLDHGADPNATADLDMTPLHWAAMRANVDVLGLLLRRGARVEARNSYGMAPLHLAASAKVVEALCGAGARIDGLDARGMTPLHTARHGDVAKALLQRNADFRVPDAFGRRPLDLAVIEALEREGLVFYGLRAAARLRGERGSTELGVMNISGASITDLMLVASSPLCDAEITPAKVTLRPGQMTGFAVSLRRRAGAPEVEQPLAFAVTGNGRQLGGFDLMVDTRSGETPEDHGMIRIGQATIRKAPSRWQYAAYAGAPLLVVVAWLLLQRRR